MKRSKQIAAFLIAGLSLGAVSAQQGMKNYGAMRLHNGGAMGVHGDFYNEGSFEQNNGLVGFYSDSKAITLGGSRPIELQDVEVAAGGGVLLENSLVITNNTNLVVGDFRTGRNPLSTGRIRFGYDSFYTGESPASKVDGVAAMENKEAFTFPVGTAEKLRPLTLESQASNAVAVCAYYPDNPGKTFGFSPGTSGDGNPVLKVSDREYWTLEGDLPSRVTLSWDASSYVESLARDPEGLRVIGWSREAGRWVDLGNTQVTGHGDSGTVRSDYFVPGAYEMLTLGGAGTLSGGFELVQLDNYFLSPNGDGRNDRLEIEAVAASPSNRLEILDRNRVLVYQKENYNNEFDGFPNTGNVVNGAILEEGVYFYIITLYDLGQRHQGYFYLSR